MAKKKKVPTFRRQNITDTLLQKWQSLRRANDAQAIVSFIAEQHAKGDTDYSKSFSVSTINNALAYGFCSTYELQHAITNFYWAREQADNAAAAKLNGNVEAV